MTIEQTKNNIRYDWCVTGTDAGIFTIYPMKGVDNRASILIAKNELRQEYDVVYIHLTWINKEQAEKLDAVKGQIIHSKPELDFETKQLA